MNRTQAEYLSLIVDAAEHFSEYSNRKDFELFLEGKENFSSATNLLYTKGERWHIYQERQVMMAALNIMEKQPSEIDKHMDSFLQALNQILNDPFRAVSYGELLNFVNAYNHSKE